MFLTKGQVQIRVQALEMLLKFLSLKNARLCVAQERITAQREKEQAERGKNKTKRERWRWRKRS